MLRIAFPALALSCLLLATEGGAAPECPGEASRARVTARRIEREWPLRPADTVSDFVQRVGARLAQAGPPTPQPWTFTTVRDRAPNAFAIGANRVYVHDGTLSVAESEAELAAVIAHEMGHQLAGHFCDESDFATDLLGGLLGNGGAAGDHPLGSLRQAIDPEKEREADRRSLRLLEDAGYDPTAALTVARRIADAAPGSGRHLQDRRRLGGLVELLADRPRRGRLDFDRQAFESARWVVRADRD